MIDPFTPRTLASSLSAYLLDRIDLDTCLALQDRIAADIALRDDGRVAVLLAEHPPVVTLGRGGGAAGALLRQPLLARHRLDLRWVKRGGGCLAHGPGQLALYVILPLKWYGFTLGKYLELLEQAVSETLRSLGVQATCPRVHGEIWGRTGKLADLAVAVRNGVTLHGAFLNVSPRMGLLRLAEDENGSSSSLVTELRRPPRMASVRSTLVERLVEAFGCGTCHLFTGHPLLRRKPPRPL
jgi:lipoyl(octanoyl) transferase